MEEDLKGKIAARRAVPSDTAEREKESKKTTLLVLLSNDLSFVWNETECASVALPVLPHKPGVVAYAVTSIIWMYAPMSEISVFIAIMLPSFFQSGQEFDVGAG